jgi:hypothetical protein
MKKQPAAKKYFIRGSVGITDNFAETPIKASIKAYDSQVMICVGETDSDPETGKWEIVLCSNRPVFCLAFENGVQIGKLGTIMPAVSNG